MTDVSATLEYLLIVVLLWGHIKMDVTRRVHKADNSALEFKITMPRWFAIYSE
jgi:hypothetical protein